MLDWLRRPAGEVPQLALDDRELPIVIRRLAQARRMTLRLAPDGSEVRISMPRWGRTAEALAFAAARRDWLQAQLVRLPIAAPPLPGGTLAFRGEVLRVEHIASAPRRPVLDDGAVVLGGPETGLDRRLRRWLEGEARALLETDLAFFCARAERSAPGLSLSNARRRWGSCAGNGTIRINWRLIMAPDHVRRSVVAHEVAHLAHFDHSPRFHAFLAEIYDADIKTADHWLKQHGRTLYAPFG
jgi:predicted metal-dependent hydrolase